MIASTPVLTDAGKSLLMRAIAGEEVVFTRFKAGSGTLPAGRAIADLTDLIHTVLAFQIINAKASEHGYVTVSGEFTNEDVTADFTWRELGLFAKGEDNVEVLYAYANDGASAGVIRAISSQIITVQTVNMIVAVGEAESISVDYTPQEIPQTVLAVNCGTVSSLPKTVNDPRITGDMVVVKSVLGNTAAQQSDWTVTTSTGSLTITGSISGSTTVVLYLARALD